MYALLIEEKKLCSQVSLEAGEPCIGTAPRTDIWCLLEYTERWNESAVKDSSLSPEVRNWLEEARRCWPNFRTQFIKQHDRPLNTITCFFAVTQEHRQMLYQLQLPSYEALLQIDLAALVEGDAHYAPFQVSEPIFLVCTHGKHNRCCAKLGLPVYTEAVSLAASQVWQTSHLGGDKFAANLVCLPQGTYYGRVGGRDVEAILSASLANCLDLDHYRGRCCYTGIEQAAEIFLRQQTGILDLSAFRLCKEEAERSVPGRMTFVACESGSHYYLTVQVDPTEVTTYSSCSGLKTNTINYYRLRDYTVQASDSRTPRT